MNELAKFLILSGLVLIAVGILFLVLGRLPGDVFIKRDNFTFYFPLATSIILSVIVSLLIYFFNRK